MGLTTEATGERISEPEEISQSEEEGEGTRNKSSST